MKLPPVRSKTISLGGGVDQATAQEEVTEGKAIQAINFICGTSRGFERINGYERTAGGVALGSKPWHVLRVNSVSGLTVATTITTSSGGTFYILAVDSVANDLLIVNLSGSILKDATLTGHPGVSVTTAPLLRGVSNKQKHAEWSLISDNYYRASIQPVPGVGNVLGTFEFKGLYYAFRSNGSKVILYRGNGLSWDAVPMFRVLPFKNGVLAAGDITVGNVINGVTSGTVATVKKIIVNKGTYGVDASGYLVLAVSSGAFVANEAVSKGGITKLTASAADYAVSFDVGVNIFRTIEYNFFASSSTLCVYGCDGVNPAFEFDGVVLTPILLPTLVDAPEHNSPTYVTAHNNYLWLAFRGGSVQRSVLGAPLVWNSFLGAADYGLGFEVTGMVSIIDTVLIVSTEQQIRGFYGSSEATLQLKMIANDTGCVAGTSAVSIRPYVLTDMGLIRLDASQNYGNFESNTVSRAIWPTLSLNLENKKIIGVCVSRELSSYILYFDDGSGVIMTQDGMYADQTPPSFTTFKYAHAPTCVNACNGSGEVLLFGDKNGYVYRNNVGDNFDGAEMEYVLRLPFMNLGYSMVRLRFKHAVFSIISKGYSLLRFGYTLTNGESHTKSSRNVSIDSVLPGGYWGLSEWGNFSWGSPAIDQQIESIDGRGTNISILFYGKSAICSSFRLSSIKLMYILGRLDRG